MEIIKLLCWVIQFISASSIIILVLLQQGKGADAGATFGSSSASGSLFGAKGSSNFLSRLTAIFATVFFVTTMALVIFSAKSNTNMSDIMKGYISNSAVVNTSKNVPQKLVKVESTSTKNQIPN